MPSFLESVQDNVTGLSPVYGSKCCLTYLAISSMTQVLVISLSSKGKKHSKKNQPDLSGLHEFLRNPMTLKSAFHMDNLAASLYYDHGIRVENAKDLLSFGEGAERESLAAFMNALGGIATLHKNAAIDLFNNLESRLNKPKSVALQAWAACCAASAPGRLPRLLAAPGINTSILDDPILKMVAKSIRDMNRLVSLKPTRVKHEVERDPVIKSGELTVISQRYKTKVNRTEGNRVIQIKTLQRDGKTITHTARTSQIHGRSARLTVRGHPRGKIQSMESVGREKPTNVEESRTRVMLQVLQSQISLSTHPLIKAIWLPSMKATQSKITKNLSPLIYFPSERKLNPSQEKAIKAILSPDPGNPIILIHGPPGTGKTTVIAASVTSTLSLSNPTSTLWLVAQSNIAVKNIAEKLASVDFLNFKVIISKDYHFDWHEHQYEKLVRNLIRSDKFPADLVSAERELEGARVILCTLGMLSNSKLAIITRLVPLQTVIFDEASQIEIGDYLPMLIHFRFTLRKLVFIGDDKQLAPYGSSDVSDLESIFEKAHLRRRAILLDTQYRMPIPIGDFISHNVYKDLLKSQHGNTKPSCCRFVNVSNSVEESKGHSWTNAREVDVAIKIASQLASQGKSYRIITPYDPQRSLLENGLKNAKLAWQDKCFNVDSFQGNEDDYIIISIVRTKKLGFLSEMRRVNVMLTRCKKGMIICTNRNFIEGPASESLVGKLHRSLGNSPWIEGRKILHDGFRPFI